MNLIKVNIQIIIYLQINNLYTDKNTYILGEMFDKCIHTFNNHLSQDKKTVSLLLCSQSYPTLFPWEALILHQTL